MKQLIILMTLIAPLVCGSNSWAQLQGIPLGSAPDTRGATIPSAAEISQLSSPAPQTFAQAATVSSPQGAGLSGMRWVQHQTGYRMLVPKGQQLRPGFQEIDYPVQPNSSGQPPAGTLSTSRVASPSAPRPVANTATSSPQTYRGPPSQTYSSALGSQGAPRGNKLPSMTQQRRYASDSPGITPEGMQWYQHKTGYRIVVPAGTTVSSEFVEVDTPSYAPKASQLQQQGGYQQVPGQRIYGGAPQAPQQSYSPPRQAYAPPQAYQFQAAPQQQYQQPYQQQYGYRPQQQMLPNTPPQMQRQLPYQPPGIQTSPPMTQNPGIYQQRPPSMGARTAPLGQKYMIGPGGQRVMVKESTIPGQGWRDATGADFNRPPAGVVGGPPQQQRGVRGFFNRFLPGR